MLAYSTSSYIWLDQGCLIISSVTVLYIVQPPGCVSSNNTNSCVTVCPVTIQIHQSGLTCVLCLRQDWWLPHLYLKKNPSILQDVQSTWIEINVSPYPLKSGWYVVSLCHCQDIVHLVQSGINIKYFVWDQQHNWIKTADMFLCMYFILQTKASCPTNHKCIYDKDSLRLYPFCPCIHISKNRGIQYATGSL